MGTSYSVPSVGEIIQSISQNLATTEYFADTPSKKLQMKHSITKPVDSLNIKSEDAICVDIIHGFLRDVVGDEFDCKELCCLIQSYYFEGHAKYYDHSTDSNDLIKYQSNQSIKFGDIIKVLSTSEVKDMSWRLFEEIRKTRKQYQIIDINGNSIDIGSKAGTYCCKFRAQYRYFYQINIPFKICKHLCNAPKFFSKFDDDKEFNDRIMEYVKKMVIKHDDQWVIETLGGPLSAEYHSIEVRFVKRWSRGEYMIRTETVLNVDFDGKFKQQFNLHERKYTSEYIAKCYRILK